MVNQKATYYKCTYSLHPHALFHTLSAKSSQQYHIFLDTHGRLHYALSSIDTHAHDSVHSTDSTTNPHYRLHYTHNSIDAHTHDNIYHHIDNAIRLANIKYKNVHVLCSKS